MFFFIFMNNIGNSFTCTLMVPKQKKIQAVRITYSNLIQRKQLK